MAGNGVDFIEIYLLYLYFRVTFHARSSVSLQLITESKTNITALFFYHGVKKEIQLWKEAQKSPPPSDYDRQKILQKCKISISKYAKAVLLCKSFMRNNSSLEILIVGDEETYQIQEVEKETFALIRLKG